MTDQPPSSDMSALSTLTGLASDLRDASDEAVLRVTQVIDRLPDRGKTDRILDAVRPRLGALRPKRPTGFARAIFNPLQPVLVSTATWRTSDPTIPRGIILPVADLIHAGLPDAAAIDHALARGVPPGSTLWTEAASILERRALSTAWTTPAFQLTGIRRQSIPFLIDAVRLIFAHRTALAPALVAPDELAEAAEGLMAAAARAGPMIWKLALTLLFEQTEAPARLVQQVLTLARRTANGHDLEDGMHAVIGGVVSRLPLPDEQADTAIETLRDQAAAAARIVSFCILCGEMNGRSSTLLGRGEELARRASAQIARGLRGATSEAPEPALPRDVAEMRAVERLEERLRALRSLDLATRPISNGRDRDRLLSDAAREMSRSTRMSWLAPADRLRLCEILVGSEGALRLCFTPDD